MEPGTVAHGVHPDQHLMGRRKVHEASVAQISEETKRLE